MPWGLCSRCGWCLVPVPCLVPVRALIVSSFNPSPASRHTQPAHGDSAVFFSDSDSDIGLLSCLALSLDPSCHTPYPVYISCLSALLLHLRLRCIDSWLLPLSSHHNLSPVPCSTPFHRLSFSFSFYSRTCLRGLYVYILVHLQVSNRAVLTSHKPWPYLALHLHMHRLGSTQLTSPLIFLSLYTPQLHPGLLFDYLSGD